MGTPNHRKYRNLKRRELNQDPSKLCPKGWVYSGDRDICAGGVFIDLSNLKFGYADALQVVELDSAAGMEGGILIERVVINVRNLNAKDKREQEDARRAIESGIGLKQYRTLSPRQRSIARVMACLEYGFRDPGEDYHTPHTEIIQGGEGPMVFDGWKASKRVKDADVLGYLWAEWLRAMV